MAENNSSAPLKTAEGAPVAQWQKRHPDEEGGAWQNTNRGDAMWWRDNSQGWEIRPLYEAAPQAEVQAEPVAKEVARLRALFEAADKGMHAEAARGDTLAAALRGMLQLDEENHQRYAGDEDVCKEVRDAKSALAYSQATAPQAQPADALDAKRIDDLYIALEVCAAELFAQCGDQGRAMKYVEQARKALATEQCARAAMAATQKGGNASVGKDGAA